MKRETGFYRVKLNENSNWTVGLYIDHFMTWEIIGSERIFQDGFFYEVNETKITF